MPTTTITTCLSVLLLLLVLFVNLTTAKPSKKKPTSNEDICFAAPTKPEDRRVDKSRLRVVQYNAEWLFLGQNNKDCPGSQCPWKDDAMAIKHAQEVAQVLGALDGDIVNLCEVEGCDEMMFLQDQLPNKGYKYYLKKGSDSATGQNVALLTRLDPSEDLQRATDTTAFPVEGSTCNYGGKGGKKGSSKNYYTTVRLENGMNVSLVSAHLLAYPQDKTRCVEREAQATVLTTVIQERIHRGDEVIFFGDLNDFDGQVLDANNNKPISQTLQILKGEVATTDNNKQQEDSGLVLHNVASYLVQSQRYTDWFDRDHDCQQDPTEVSMIDHILVTPGLFNRVSGVSVDHSYREYCGTLDSDHWPVVVDFDLS